MKRILGLPTRHPGAVLLATFALTAALCAGIVDLSTGEPRLKIDASVDRILPDGDASRDFFDRMSRKFGTRETLVIALTADDVFTPENLATVKRVTERLEQMEGVKRVVSMANALNIRSVGSDIEVEPFLLDLPESADVIERIRSDVLRNPIYEGNLVSRDSRAAAVVVYLGKVTDADFVDEDLDLEIAQAARDDAGKMGVLFTGPAHIKAHTTRLIFASLARIVPIALGLMALIGLVVYRSVLGVVVPIVAMILAIGSTLGAVAWLGVSLNLVTTIVPPLLLVIGFAYAIHVVTGFYQARELDPDEVAAAGGPAAWSLAHVALPVTLSGVTTIAGFLSLLISPFPAVREFGLISMLGIVFTILVSLTFVPAMFQIFGSAHVERARPRGIIQGGIDRALEALGNFNVRRRVAVLAAGGLVALVSLAGMTRITINSDLVSNFPDDDSVRLDFEGINSALEGANPFFVILESDVRDAFVQPENLQQVERIQEWLEEQPEVGGTTSIVDYVKLLHRALQEDDPEAFSIPERPRLTKQLLFFGASNELDGYVDSRFQTTNIHVRANTVDSMGTARLVERLEERLAELPDHLRAQPTGNSVLLVRAMDDVAAGQIETLSVAFLFIYAILVGLFTSFRVGFFALVPNVIPVLFYFGALGIAGIGLNTTTGLFACMILGVAVDDTIHFLTTFNAQARESVDEKKGAVQALRFVGRPVTITTVGLCLGFLAISTSDLKNQSEFAALGAFTLAFAWLVDVTFTPALCAGMRVVTLWDALTFDLGRDPHLSIPIFHGLSKTQARIAALTTRVVQIPAGEAVFRVGEPGDELYVMIDGEMAASIETDNGRVELMRSKRGDVVGEVALYYGTRTADVDTVSDVRALRLTRNNLERLRRRYPRIGARVFWNLSEVLAARLARVTQRVS